MAGHATACLRVAEETRSRVPYQNPVFLRSGLAAKPRRDQFPRFTPPENRHNRQIRKTFLGPGLGFTTGPPQFHDSDSEGTDSGSRRISRMVTARTKLHNPLMYTHGDHN
jgi:hypothetical protein